MEWLSGMALGVAGTVVSSWLKRKFWPEIDRTKLKMVSRFRELLAAHEIPRDQASRLLGEQISAVEFASDAGIARVLTPERIDLVCKQLGISNDWLIRGEGKHQSTWSIEQGSSCWIDELAEVKQSHDIKIVICRSEPVELEDNARQAGAIILLRQVGTCGSEAILACLPCMSLQSWDVPQQRDLAIRLITACNALRIRMVGVTIPELDCHRIAAGEQLAATYALKCRTMVWHPEDYGHSRRSASAKCSSWHREAVTRMETSGQVERLVVWQEELGIRGDWAADAILRPTDMGKPPMMAVGGR